jgi:uncharacterized protein YcbX
MAVQGKKEFKFYLDENNVEFLRNHFKGRSRGDSLSTFIDKYLERSVKIAKMNKELIDKIEPGRMTFKKFWKLSKMEFPS